MNQYKVQSSAGQWTLVWTHGLRFVMGFGLIIGACISTLEPKYNFHGTVPVL